MTLYQDCHRHYGYLTHAPAIARKLLEIHGRPCPETVKELRNETDMPMAECADMLRCMWRDMELELLQAENSKLIEFASAMYRSILLVPDSHVSAETKARYFETAVSFGFDVPDD